MIFEIRPAISEKGIEYYVRKVEDHSTTFRKLWVADELRYAPISETSGKYGFGKYSGYIIHLSTPQEAAEKIRELYGTTATINVVRL